MGFLAGLGGGNSAGERFVICDGLRELPEAERPDLICVDEARARLLGVPCLRLPVRELGVLAARVLMNFLHQHGARPSAVLVRPPLLSDSGEPLLLQNR